jgi:cholesterol oxidase
VRLDAVLSGDRTTRAMPYLGMGNDSSDGTMRLHRGELDVSWSPRRNRDMYRLMERTLADISTSAGGRYEPSFLGRWPLRRSLTAHPLGGCPMGDDPSTSVVDDLGRVHGHPGMHVIDGSIIPTALAVNPSLTIAALAERSVAAMIAADSPA